MADDLTPPHWGTDAHKAALDDLIAGDAGLYEVRECPYNHPVGTRCPACAHWPFKKGGAKEYEQSVRSASARITEDKDRETPVERPQPHPEYIAGIAEGRAMAAPQGHWTVKAAILAAREVIKAGDLLSVQAQTTGGTAGYDAGLCAAIAHWAAERDKCQKRLRIIELEGDDPEIGCGAYRTVAANAHLREEG